MVNEELVKLYQNGDNQALEELLENNKKFIYKISNKLSTAKDNAVDQEDLIQEGRIGLIKAAERYNSDMDTGFISYAYYWIYQCMYRFMYPKRSMVNATIRFVSINVPVGDEEDTELGDMLADDKDEFCSVEESIYHQELCKELHAAIENELNPREKQVLSLRFGLDGGTYTLEQIGRTVGVSKERIRQIEVESLKKLRTGKWGRLKRREYEEEHPRVISTRETATMNKINEMEKELSEYRISQLQKEIDIMKGQGLEGCIKYLKEKQENIRKKMMLMR